MAHRNADLVAEMAVKLETAQMELEGVVNQREAAWEALAKEVAQVQADRGEATRVRFQVEETLSKNEAD